MKEDIFKVRFLEKYNYALENMDIINALYFGNSDHSSFYEIMEHLLFDNDDLNDNESYKHLEFVKSFKGILIGKYLEKYKKEKTMYYRNCLEMTPKNNERSIEYYNSKINKIEALTEEEFVKKLDFYQFINIMYSYIYKQPKNSKNRQKKLDVICLYALFCKEFNKDYKNDEAVDNPVIRNRKEYVKNNEYIDYFSENKEAFNEEIVRKRKNNENRN